MEPHQAGEVRREEEHVSQPEQLVGAPGVEDDPGIDLGRDAEGDAAAEVVLDRAGDDVDRRPLGGHDEVDADGPGQLGQAGDAALDLLGADHHQLGQLVDDDDDVGERLEDLLLLLGQLPLLLLECLLDGLVELDDVPDLHLAELPQPLLHLPDGVEEDEARPSSGR